MRIAEEKRLRYFPLSVSGLFGEAKQKKIVVLVKTPSAAGVSSDGEFM
jgi:hypothetical protein